MRNNNHQAAAKSLFMSSVFGLANTLAVVAAFFGVPTLYGRTIIWVQNFTGQHYGTGFEDLIGLAWFVICACFIFFTARASVGTALVMGGLAIITRMM